MAVELEAKVKVTSHEPLRIRLQEIGARFVSRGLETNRFFDRPDSSLYKAGCGLRVRSVENEKGEPPAAQLTFKGPLGKSSMKQREELETAVDDPQSLVSILIAMGFVERIVFEKRRETWRHGDCEIVLDELPRVGRFVEVEGPEEEAIHNVLKELRLNPKSVIQESYVAMLAKAFGEPTDKPVIARF